ncbi:hypothetical protein [Piscirickettsia litoralis]|uniref:ABC transporter permease n=1 Tax=Piscirickettsia litoralis TaxID=1891921 RepID=A0ABX3A3E3_9GAMM|nr:hypothetical protein [Piscirickettsia litoralis]ODN42757.1 hypothetical protein BGC07_07250 [Piscirickettsia litoralis]
MLTLFAMPAIFLLVISIIQFHTLEQNGPSLTLYLINQDSGKLSKQFITTIKKQPSIDIKTLNPKETRLIQRAKKQVASHANRVLIEISADASEKFSQIIKQQSIGQSSAQKSHTHYHNHHQPHSTACIHRVTA